MDWVKRGLPSAEVELEFDNEVETPKAKRRRTNVSAPRRQVAPLQESESSGMVGTPATDRDPPDARVDDNEIRTQESGTKGRARRKDLALPSPSTSGYQSTTVPPKPKLSPLRETSVNIAVPNTRHSRRGKVAWGHPPLEVEETCLQISEGGRLPLLDSRCSQLGRENPGAAGLGGKTTPVSTNDSNITASGQDKGGHLSSNALSALGKTNDTVRPSTRRYRGRLEVRDSEDELSEDELGAEVKTESSSDDRAYREAHRLREKADDTPENARNDFPDNTPTSREVKVDAEPASRSADTAGAQSPLRNRQDDNGRAATTPRSIKPVSESPQENDQSPASPSPNEQLDRETPQSCPRVMLKAEESSSPTNVSQEEDEPEDPYNAGDADETAEGARTAETNSLNISLLIKPEAQQAVDDADENNNSTNNEDEDDEDDEEEAQEDDDGQQGDAHHLDSLTASQLLPESLMRDFLPMPPPLTQETNEWEES